MGYTSEYARKAMGEKTPASRLVKVSKGKEETNSMFVGSTKKTKRGSVTKLKNSQFGSIKEKVRTGRGGETNFNPNTTSTRTRTTARKQRTVMKDKSTGMKIVQVKRFKIA